MLGARVELVARDAADVIVVDSASASDALAAIAAGFAVPTLLLVDDPHAELTRAALAAGACAVLARQSEPRELLAALEAVAAGLIVVDAAARDALGSPALGPRAAAGGAASVDGLTERERDVLAMLARGLSNRRIGERLAISENTVKAHVGAVLAKLGAATRTEAVAIGIRLGLVML